MEIELIDGVYYVSGDITEASNLATMDIPRDGEVYFDMRNVRSINSCGVKQWVRGIQTLGIFPVYQNCNESIVMQLNMVREFIEDARVTSVIVSAYCSHCNKSVSFELISGRDFHPGRAAEWKLPLCEAGCQMESDVELDIYLYFVEGLKR